MGQTSAYPPGTWAGDPAAPWNQKETPDLDLLREALDTVGHLEELCGSEEALNFLIPKIRQMFGEINAIILAVEDGDVL